MARQTDHRNQQKLLLPAFCFHAWKEESSELSIILSGGSGRPSGCPGQHDAPVQKLNARPALPSSSPTVDFPPLYPTWASQTRPARCTQCKTVSNQFCCHKPNLYQSRAQVGEIEKLLVLWWSQLRLGWMWTVDRTLQRRQWKENLGKWAKGAHCDDIHSVLVKISKLLETKQNSHCTPLLPALRFCPPLLFCCQVWRSVQCLTWPFQSAVSWMRISTTLFVSMHQPGYWWYTGTTVDLHFLQ